MCNLRNRIDGYGGMTQAFKYVSREGRAKYGWVRTEADVSCVMPRRRLLHIEEGMSWDCCRTAIKSETRFTREDPGRSRLSK